MKCRKILCLMLVCFLTICFVSCENTGSENANLDLTEIDLTADNIKNYVDFTGEFVDGKYESFYFFYVADATLEFQAYPVVAGNFNNVEIVLKVIGLDSTFEGGALGEKWHLSDATEKDRTHIKITFKLGADGKFSKNYSVTCDRCSGILEGGCTFEIVSVTGTFTPSN